MFCHFIRSIKLSAFHSCILLSLICEMQYLEKLRIKYIVVFLKCYQNVTFFLSSPSHGIPQGRFGLGRSCLSAGITPASVSSHPPGSLLSSGDPRVNPRAFVPGISPGAFFIVPLLADGFTVDTGLRESLPRDLMKGSLILHHPAFRTVPTIWLLGTEDHVIPAPGTVVCSPVGTCRYDS